MYKDIKSIRNVKFPLYSVPSNNFDVIDGVCFVDGFAIDDLNMKGESIGVRRLQSRRSDLYKLKSPINTLGELIRTKKNHFISSDGKMFTYEKTGFQQLKYHVIKKFDLRDTFTFLHVQGISVPFELSRPPANRQLISWVRILYYKGYPWMVYDYSHKSGKNSRIKV